MIVAGLSRSYLSLTRWKDGHWSPNIQTAGAQVRVRILIKAFDMCILSLAARGKTGWLVQNYSRLSNTSMTDLRDKGIYIY